MKKHLLVLIFASVFMVAANTMYTVNLTIINKSEVKIGLMLDSLTDKDRWYYLTVPRGYPEELFDDDMGTERHFEIVRDVYAATLHYIEPYDPVYGYPYCGNRSVSGRLHATHNMTVVIKPCKKLSYHPGIYQKLRDARNPKIRER